MQVISFRGSRDRRTSRGSSGTCSREARSLWARFSCLFSIRFFEVGCKTLTIAFLAVQRCLPVKYIYRTAFLANCSCWYRSDYCPGALQVPLPSVFGILGQASDHRAPLTPHSITLFGRVPREKQYAGAHRSGLCVLAQNTQNCCTSNKSWSLILAILNRTPAN